MSNSRLAMPRGSASLDYLLGSLLVGLSLFTVLRNDWPAAFDQLWLRFSFFLSIPFV